MRFRVWMSTSAIVVVMLVLVFSVRAAADSLDYVWGHMPGIRVVRTVTLSEDDSLHVGDWFQVVYKIKVKKWVWQSEDDVRREVIHHFENILGRTIREHPELRIYYAEYHHYKTENRGLYKWYYYKAKIIGHVEPLQLSADPHTTSVRLVSWVAVAVIITLVIAAIIATIKLVQQPAVQKLLTAIANAVNRASSALTVSPWILPTIMMASLGIASIALLRK